LDNHNRRKNRRKISRNKKYIVIVEFFICTLILIGLGITSFYLINNKSQSEALSIADNSVSSPDSTPPIEPTPPVEPIKVKKEILISAAGDCILGRDSKLDYDSSLPAMWINQEKDY